jgi:hypothetical protein
MADDEKPKTGNGRMPATPLAWQTNPPGPPGAAIDPPPCSPSGVPFDVSKMASPAPAFTAPHEGYPPAINEKGGWMAFSPFLLQNPNQPMAREPLARADPNAKLGTPTAPSQLKKLMDASGYKLPEARGMKCPHNGTPDATRR